MELDEKLQELQKCALRRIQQANELIELLDSIENERQNGANDEYIKTLIHTHAQYTINRLRVCYATLDKYQYALLESLASWNSP